MFNLRIVTHSLAALLLVLVSLPTSLSTPAEALNRPGMRKDHHAAVRKIIEKTRRILRRAAEAVNKGGKEKDKLRSAFVHQQGARAALRRDKPIIAAHLSLEARRMARMVSQANGGKLDRGDDTDEAAETMAAKGAVESDAHGFVSEVEAGVPSADNCAKSADACDKE